MTPVFTTRRRFILIVQTSSRNSKRRTPSAASASKRNDSPDLLLLPLPLQHARNHLRGSGRTCFRASDGSPVHSFRIPLLRRAMACHPPLDIPDRLGPDPLHTSIHRTLPHSVLGNQPTSGRS